MFVRDCPASDWSAAPNARFPNEEQPLPDVANPAWWTLLADMVDEIASIFPEAYFHGGADEVNPGCWEKSATTRSFMKQQGLETSSAVVNYFHTRLAMGGAVINLDAPIFHSYFSIQNNYDKGV